jgi:hypothetical protein
MTDSEMALQFVKSCNGICTKKNIQYLMKLVHKEYGRDGVIPANIWLTCGGNYIYVEVSIDRLTNYYMPIDCGETVLTIIDNTGKEYFANNHKIIARLSKANFDYAETAIEQDGYKYNLALQDTYQDKRTFVVVDMKTRQVVFIICDEEVWIESIAAKHFPYLQKYAHHIQRDKDCWSANNFDILPENIRKQAIAAITLTKLGDIQ